MIAAKQEGALRGTVIGLGHIARQHIAALQQCPDAQLVGVCDRSAATAEATAERYGIPRWFTDHRQMLDELRPDVVHVATPPSSHTRLAHDALDAGAHAIVEKPLAPRFKEVQSLLECSAERKRVLIEDYNYVFDPQVQHVLKLIETGEFGDVPHFELMLCLDISQAAGGVADSSASSCLAAGPVGDFFPHLASLAYFFVGAAVKVRTVSPRPLEFRSIVEAERGTASIHFSSASQPDGFWLRVYGSQMQATINLFEPLCAIHRVRRGPKPLTPLWNGLDVARSTRRAAWRGLSRKLSGSPGSYAGLHELVHRCYGALAAAAPPPISPRQIDDVNRFVQQLGDEENRA
jgi:predicted dehydrogenase